MFASAQQKVLISDIPRIRKNSFDFNIIQNESASILLHFLKNYFERQTSTEVIVYIQCHQG